MLFFRLFQIWLKPRKTELNLAEEGYGSDTNTESEGRFGISLLITGGRAGVLWHSHAPQEQPERARGALEPGLPSPGWAGVRGGPGGR